MKHPFMQLLKEANSKGQVMPEWIYEEWLKVLESFSLQEVLEAVKARVTCNSVEEVEAWREKYIEQDVLLSPIAELVAVVGPKALMEQELMGVVLQQLSIAFGLGYVIAKMKYENPLPPEVR